MRSSSNLMFVVIFDYISRINLINEPNIRLLTSKWRVFHRKKLSIKEIN